jgi:ABC-type uncharacterized transport system auxiliary subunit
MRADHAMHDSFAIAPRIADRLALALALLASLAGCAPATGPETAQSQAQAQPQTQVAMASSRADMQESPICRPDSALLAPQNAPDCVFGRAELKTLDPNQWARLKIEYERRCYQRAERSVRERLRQLQAAAKCANGTLVR